MQKTRFQYFFLRQSNNFFSNNQTQQPERSTNPSKPRDPQRNQQTQAPDQCRTAWCFSGARIVGLGGSVTKKKLGPRSGIVFGTVWVGWGFSDDLGWGFGEGLLGGSEHLYQRGYKCYNPILASRAPKIKLQQSRHSSKNSKLSSHLKKYILLF